MLVFRAGPFARSKRLAGVIIEDAGAASSSSVIYMVRDLQTDTLVPCTAGQVRKARAAEVAKLVRPDFAPPATCATPVSPYTMTPGLFVTRGPHWPAPGTLMPQAEQAARRPPAQSHEHGSAQSAAAANGASPAWRVGDAEGEAVMHPYDDYGAEGLVGVLVAADSDRRCTVKWPDGCVFSYRIGEGGVFDVAHFSLHWRAGAPLLDMQRTSLLPPGGTVVLPVARSALWSHGADDGLPGKLRGGDATGR